MGSPWARIRGRRRAMDGAPPRASPTSRHRESWRRHGHGKGHPGSKRKGQEIQKRKRSDRMTITVGVGYVEVEGKGELVGRGTERTHIVRLADVVAGVRRTAKRRRGGGIEIDAMNTKKLFLKEVKKQGTETDSDRDTDAATADSGENEVRRRNMRECEDAMMEDTASRRGYAPTAAWDEGNMIQAMARMKNPTIAWGMAVRRRMNTRTGSPPPPPPPLSPLLAHPTNARLPQHI